MKPVILFLHLPFLFIMKNKLCFLAFLFLSISLSAQRVPSPVENIEYLVTFGKDAVKQLGDDDCKQAYFFAIPASFQKPVFIRVFDPGVGGKIDEKIAEFNTQTKFTFYGGSKVFSNSQGKNAANLSESATGDEFMSKTFGSESEYDSAWYTFGPFNPKEGEYVASFNAYVFKVVAEGLSGNDGNLYQYFISSSNKSNLEIVGTNSFSYELTIRLNNKKEDVSHLYPYIDSDVISITQYNFDFDTKVQISLFSSGRFAENSLSSGNGTWLNSKHIIQDIEKESCIDVRISNGLKNNNGEIYMTNQYGDYIPFMTVPIGDLTYEKTFKVK